MEGKILRPILCRKKEFLLNNFISSKRLTLKQPILEELDYRQSLLADPVTMDYNKKLNLGFEGYDNDTGCIDFDETKWTGWYFSWFSSDDFKYYAYLMDKGTETPIGEVAIRYDPYKKTNMMSIIIEGKHRRNGYGKEGLILLLKKGFLDFQLEEISDEFPESRFLSKKLFEDIGFKVLSKKDGNIFIQIKKDDFLSSYYSND